MNINEAAMALDGSEYGRVGSKELFTSMASAGLVAIHGYSDDGMSIGGAVSDETYGEVYFDANGILKNQCGSDCCPYYREIIETAPMVEAVWSGAGNPCWTYKTDIPHETFKVMGYGEMYCIGIVIDLNNLEKAK